MGQGERFGGVSPICSTMHWTQSPSMMMLWEANEDIDKVIQFGVADFSQTGDATIFTTIRVSGMGTTAPSMAAINRIRCMYLISCMDEPSLVEASEFLTSSFNWQVENAAYSSTVEDRPYILPSRGLVIADTKPAELYD